MRFRPSSINYLEDASSHHKVNTTLLNIVVQRLQDGDRRVDEDDANDTEDEEPFELRSIHSGDSDDFHPYCNDDDGQITVDLVRRIVHLMLEFNGESNKAFHSTANREIFYKSQILR
jgi:hypothetical protein